MAVDTQVDDGIDHDAVVDQTKVTSTVTVVDGVITVRTYSDGSIQRNIWGTPEDAAEYAASVAAVEGK